MKPMALSRYLLFFSLILVISTDVYAQDRLRVVTTTPDAAWAAARIGGDHVEVRSLLTGTEDPHHIDVVPSFVQHVSRADIVCQIGLSLEIGWIGRVIARSGNARVQPGARGQCILGEYVEPLEVPTSRVNRSMGDVHSDGNPHFTLGPTAMIKGAQAIVDVFSLNRPEARADFEANFQALTKELNELRDELYQRLAPYRSRVRLMEYHKELSYFAKDYDLTLLGTLEEVPGIPPSAGRLSERSRFARENQVQLVIASLAASPRLLRRFQELSGVKFVQFPTMMMASGEDSDYAHWQRRLVELIIKKAVLDEDSSAEQLHPKDT